MLNGEIINSLDRKTKKALFIMIFIPKKFCSKKKIPKIVKMVAIF